jgi:predicted CXXCH cytochrome family protein
MIASEIRGLTRHREVVAGITGKKRLHWPLADRNGCVNCHNPHGSMQASLLKGTLASVCGACHGDTVARQERSQTKHPPIVEGKCAECHEPHSSDEQFLLNQASILTVCGKCHEWQSHSTHPIGEKVVDPRNKNLTVQCLSCHRSHGTEYPHFIYNETVQDLCVQCHIQYRR